MVFHTACNYYYFDLHQPHVLKGHYTYQSACDHLLVLASAAPLRISASVRCAILSPVTITDIPKANTSMNRIRPNVVGISWKRRTFARTALS